jgi:hypothetical protein
MSNHSFAAVTCLDTATSIGAADAIIVALDYRFAGEVNYAMNFIGTLASVGTGDSVTLQVSPDYKAETASGAMWQGVETFVSTAFNGSLNGPWAAARFTKAGVQTVKVVALTIGKSRNRTDLQG